MEFSALVVGVIDEVIPSLQYSSETDNLIYSKFKKNLLSWRKNPNASNKTCRHNNK